MVYQHLLKRKQHGAIFSMTPSVIVDFVGKENFRTAIAILILGQGVTLGTEAPLLGRIPLLYAVLLLHGGVSDSVWADFTDGTVCQKTSGQNEECNSTVRRGGAFHVTHPVF